MQPALYAFGDFELDASRFELRRDGSVVAVQPKVLRMLLHLVTQRERAVGTEELFAVLWPGEHVGMASIKRAVIGVRRALGEDGDSQCSVRTVRGFGYQFVREVAVTCNAPVVPLGRAHSVPPASVDSFGDQLARLSMQLAELSRALHTCSCPVHASARPWVQPVSLSS